MHYFYLNVCIFAYLYNFLPILPLKRLKNFEKVTERAKRLGLSSHRTNSTLHERIDESNRQK